MRCVSGQWVCPNSGQWAFRIAKVRLVQLKQDDTLGKYRIVRLLGLGGMGAVYLAHDEVIHRHVALKVLFGQFAADETFLSKLHAEARAIAAISHPHVLHINNVAEDAGVHFLDMEYAEGGSLADLLALDPIAPAQAVQILHEIASALSSCHLKGLIHRDVKPSNVLFDGIGVAKLSDFGLADALSTAATQSMQSGASGAFFGTPRYAPPEAWENRDATPAWDVYSLGVVAYELLANEPLFDVSSPLALLKQMMTHGVPSIRLKNEFLSPELANTVDHMLALDPAQRLRGGAAVVQALEQTPEFHESAGERPLRQPIFRLPPPVAEAHAPKSPKRRWLATLATSVLLALAVAVAVSFEGAWPRKLPAKPGSTHHVAAAADVNGTIFNCLFYSRMNNEPAAVLLDSRDNSYELSAVLDNSLWRGVLSRTNVKDTFDVSGHWAAYRDKSREVLHFGAFSGKAHWVVPHDVLTIHLTFQTAQGHNPWQETIELKRNHEGMTREDLAAKVLQSALLKPLLYDELLPRRLDWAGDLRDALKLHAQTKKGGV